METQEEVDVGVNVWVSTPTLSEFKDQLRLTLERMNPQVDEPVSASQLGLAKFNEYILNIVIKHFINDTKTDIVDLLQSSFEREYEILTTVADEIKQAIVDISFEAPFECISVNILNDDLAIAQIRYLL